MAENVATLYVEVDADDAKRAVTALANLEKQSKKNETRNKKLSKSNDALGKSFSRVKGQLSGLNAAIGALTVGTGLTASVKAFADLDKGLIGIRKTTGLAGKELAALGEDIQEIGTRLPIATTELLAIAQAAGQLGVTGRENILAFTETVGMLGTASDLVGEEAATSLARILNVTGEAASEVDVLGSVIVALGNNMATTEKEIARMATEVAQATGIFGVSSAEAAALGAAMRSLGIRAELGGSTVGRAFRTIEASINVGGEAMQRLSNITGMTGAQLRTTFATDSVAVFQAFADGLGRAIDRGESAADVLATFGLKGEEVLKTLPVLAARSDELARALNIAGKETKNATALTNEALASAESFSAQMQIVGNVANRAAADIGRELAPAILDVVKDFGEWTKNNREFIAQDVGGSIRGITEWVVNLKNATTGTAASGGAIGYALFGPKGAVVIGGTIHLIEAFMQSYAGFQAAIEGDIAWSDFATADYSELKELLSQMDKNPFESSAESARRLNAEVEKLGLNESRVDYGDVFGPEPEAPQPDPIEAPSKLYSDEYGPSAELYYDWLVKQRDILREVRAQELENANTQASNMQQRKADLAELTTLLANNEASIVQTKDAWDAAIESLDEYATSGKDSAGIVGDAITSTLNTAEDTLATFIATGEASFSDFADSIINDLARIAAQEALSGLVGTVASAFSSSSTSTTATTTQSHGGAWSKGVQFFASGGVVNSPTAFGMAGGGTGVMGEAGPEAILPLKRGSSGDLGVSAEGVGGANVYVTVQNNTDSAATVTESEDSMGNREITVMIGDAMKSNFQGGGMDKTMQSLYGVTRQGN